MELNFLRNPKNQIYIIFFEFAAGILFLIAFFVFPCLKEIKKNSQDLLSAKNNMAFLSRQVSELERFKKNYEAYRPNFKKIDRLYVDQKNLADFFEFLENTSQSSQIKSEVSISINSLEKSGRSAYFQIFSQGEFSKILKFLEKLESGPYLIEVQNLSLASEKGAIKANFSIKTHIK